MVSDTDTNAVKRPPAVPLGDGAKSWVVVLICRILKAKQLKSSGFHRMIRRCQAELWQMLELRYHLAKSR